MKKCLLQAGLDKSSVDDVIETIHTLDSAQQAKVGRECELEPTDEQLVRILTRFNDNRLSKLMRECAFVPRNDDCVQVRHVADTFPYLAKKKRKNEDFTFPYLAKNEKKNEDFTFPYLAKTKNEDFTFPYLAKKNEKNEDFTFPYLAKTKKRRLHVSKFAKKTKTSRFHILQKTKTLFSLLCKKKL